jgi:thioredoxin-dependent peroxiredoxin
MKKTLLLTLISSSLTLPAFAALKQGDLAPDFKIQASFAGKATEFSLTEKLKSGPVVVYFYPSAYTNGCNLQAHTFSVNSEKFAAAGASVIGVSQDSIKRLNDFSADPEYCAGKVLVGSDAEGKVAKAFELSVRPAGEGKLDSRGQTIDHGFTERTTFVVTPDGKISETISDLKPAENVAKALEAVQKLAAEKQTIKKG